MPYAIAGVGRSVGPFKLLGPRFQVMVPDLRQAHGWCGNAWSSGLKSQATSRSCCGGVSAVISASDLDEHTVNARGALGYQP